MGGKATPPSSRWTSLQGLGRPVVVGKNPGTSSFAALFLPSPTSDCFSSRIFSGNHGDELRRSSVWVGSLLSLLHTGHHVGAWDDWWWSGKILELRLWLLLPAPVRDQMGHFPNYFRTLRRRNLVRLDPDQTITSPCLLWSPCRRTGTT